MYLALVWSSRVFIYTVYIYIQCYPPKDLQCLPLACMCKSILYIDLQAAKNMQRVEVIFSGVIYSCESQKIGAKDKVV